MDAAINALFTFFQTLFKWALDGVLYVLKAALYFVFDGLLTIVTTIFGAIDVSTLMVNSAANWAQLPPQAIYLMSACGIPQCLSMMASAITIRMIINLIPAEFTRV